MKDLIPEAEITAALAETITPYLNGRRTVLTVTSADGTALYTLYYRADTPRGTLVITHGFGEHADKYCEFIYYCLLAGLSVLIYDQRGHGRSTRKAPLGVIHVDRFTDYLNDFDAVYAAYEKDLARPLYLFGHSMGGAIATLILEKYPARFKSAVLSAPMLDLTYKGKDRLMAVLAATAACLFTNRKKPIPVRKKEESGTPFERSNYRSPARFAATRALIEQNPLFSGGTPSRAWALAALGVRKQIFKKGTPEQVEAPILLLTAEKENRVSNEAHALFAARAPRVTHLHLADTRHEILFAEDEKAFPVLEKIHEFLR